MEFASAVRSTPEEKLGEDLLFCNQAPAPVVVKTEEPKGKNKCFGVFCLTYDLRAEEETKSWKKLISVAVSGAAGMISNHHLFKLASKEVFGADQPIALKLLGSERSFQALEGIPNYYDLHVKGHDRI